MLFDIYFIIFVTIIIIITIIIKLTADSTVSAFWASSGLPLKLSKRQLPTTVIFRTTFTRTITLYELLLLLLLLL